jgi:L-aminopeptidase/D-esterase-like protein
MTRVIVCGLLAACGVAVAVASAPPTAAAGGITAIEGIKVGHYTLAARPTGCTVILTEDGAVATVDVRGSAPGTRETALLDPTRTVQRIHAVVLAGGSAFGLAAADGVMRYLEERDVGYQTRAAKVPIVPAAILYDLGVGGDASIRPTADCGYRAAAAATGGPVAEGSVGAGAGATVGKLGGPRRAMKGGIGTALIELPDGLQVAALMAVNAVGDIYEPATGTLIAGVRSEDGLRLEGAHALLRGSAPDAGENTTIGVVATNAALSKAQLGVVARMAHDGLARAVRPAHTPVDGDAIFALSTGSQANTTGLLRIGALAADVTAEAIVRAIRAAEGVPGYPAARDLKESTP